MATTTSPPHSWMVTLIPIQEPQSDITVTIHEGNAVGRYQGMTWITGSQEVRPHETYLVLASLLKPHAYDALAAPSGADRGTQVWAGVSTWYDMAVV